jgi:hypothetical protein
MTSTISLFLESGAAKSLMTTRNVKFSLTPKKGLKRNLFAIFSADVEGFSRLMGDNEQWYGEDGMWWTMVKSGHNCHLHFKKSFKKCPDRSRKF